MFFRYVFKVKRLKNCLFLLLFLIISGCAKPNTSTDPNAYYYYGFGKYILSVNNYVPYSGLFLFPGSQTFSINYQNVEFPCRGLATYELVPVNSPFFPTNVGEVFVVNGDLREPLGQCFNQNVSLSIMYMGKDSTNQDYYEVTLNAERYLIKTNK